jgi:peptide/nickel transport system ATP-binding protein
VNAQAQIHAAAPVAPDVAALRVDDLRTHFLTGGGIARAVDGVSYHVNRGETLGVVGESGCGKSVTALSVMRLVPDPPGRIVGGRVLLDGEDLLRLDEAAMRRVRGNRIGMIFQEPMTSLNPVLTIGRQIEEVLSLHQGLSRRQAAERTVEMLRLVHIPEPRRRAREYPHQLSGGMRQRVMIAIALACDPAVLIADEPTTALDVTIQAQVLDLMREVQARTGTAIVLITHDLGVIAETADRVAVMYAGRKVEEAPVEALFDAPLHPYTRGLMASVVALDTPSGRGVLPEIPGMVPRLTELPDGCRFAPRCSLAVPRCAQEPPLTEYASGHTAACWRAGE